MPASILAVFGIALCIQLSNASDYAGLRASAFCTSRRTPGDMVDERTTLLTYAPFAPLGRARTTASMIEAIFDINASSLKESLPAGICKRAVLSTRNSTRPALTSRTVRATSIVIVPALGWASSREGRAFYRDDRPCPSHQEWQWRHRNRTSHSQCAGSDHPGQQNLLPPPLLPRLSRPARRPAP